MTVETGTELTSTWPADLRCVSVPSGDCARLDRLPAAWLIVVAGAFVRVGLAVGLLALALFAAAVRARTGWTDAGDGAGES